MRALRMEGNLESGFSLIEILVALAILAILVAAVSRGLMTSLTSDLTSEQLFSGGLVVNRVETAIVRGAEPAQLQEITGSEWTLTEEHMKASETNAFPWRILRLQSAARPSLSLRLTLRE